MNIFLGIWTYFADNILKQPAFMIGFIVMIGYILLQKPWYEILAGTVKSIAGFFILQVGSGGMVGNFRPFLVGLKEKFNLQAMVIDPYFGNVAVDKGVPEVFGKAFSAYMILLFIAFIVNIILVRFSKYTKLRGVFTTGNVQVQQAATAYWLILFALPAIRNNDTLMLAVMAVLLGLYWAVGTNLTVKPCQELTDGAGFSIAHQQMFGLAFFSWLSEKIGKMGKGKDEEVKKIEDIELPGAMTIFNDNMVATSILMLGFFGSILLILGKPYLIEKGFLKEGASFLFYILNRSIHFAVYLAILQLGVRTFVGELTVSFQGIANKVLPGAVPGVDCAVSFGFGSPNAVTIGFMAGAFGQFLAILTLIIFKSPVLVIAGFVPVFFDNALIGVFANDKGGLKAALICPFMAGLTQVFGSAAIAYWVGMSAYGGYLGMFDWASVWPFFTVVIRYGSYIGVAAVIALLVAIPQIQYARDKEGYFLITEDYEAYKALKNK